MARTAKTKTARRKTATRKASKRSVKKWSGYVTEHSDAMDLKDDVFKQRSAAAIARSLKHSAESSHRRKSPRSAPRCRC